jgi:hypothetical protein
VCPLRLPRTRLIGFQRNSTFLFPTRSQPGATLPMKSRSPYVREKLMRDSTRLGSRAYCRLTGNDPGLGVTEKSLFRKLPVVSDGKG